MRAIARRGVSERVRMARQVRNIRPRTVFAYSNGGVRARGDGARAYAATSGCENNGVRARNPRAAACDPGTGDLFAGFGRPGAGLPLRRGACDPDAGGRMRSLLASVRARPARSGPFAPGTTAPRGCDGRARADTTLVRQDAGLAVFCDGATFTRARAATLPYPACPRTQGRPRFLNTVQKTARRRLRRRGGCRGRPRSSRVRVPFFFFVAIINFRDDRFFFCFVFRYPVTSSNARVAPPVGHGIFVFVFFSLPVSIVLFLPRKKKGSGRTRFERLSVLYALRDAATRLLGRPRKTGFFFVFDFFLSTNFF